MPPDLRLLMSKPNWPSSDIARVFQGEYDPGVLVNFRSLNRAEKVNLLIALGFMYDRQSNNISHYRIAEILKMAADDGDKTVSFLGVIIGKYLLCGIEPKEQSFVTMLQEHLSFNIIKEADGLLDAWVQDLGIQRTLHANDASFIHPLEAPYAPMRHLQQNVASLNPHFSCDLSKLKFRLEGQARIKKLYGEQDAPPKTPSSVHTTSKPSLQRRTSTSAAGSTSGQNPQKHQQAPIAPPSRKQAPPTQSGLRPSSSSLFVKRNTHATSTSYARPVERRSMVKHPNGARTQKISFSEVTEFNQSISENHDRALEERRQERLRQAEITKRRRTLEAQEAREAKRAAKLRR